MANNIGWGQGANNNNIGWGLGAYNNAISWGKSQNLSWAGETDIFGGLFQINLSFQSRVSTDSGIFESQQCLINNLMNFKTL